MLTKYKLNVGTSSVCSSAPICAADPAKSAINFECGTNLSISSSGTTTGTAIVWAVSGNGWPTANNPAPAVLYAFDAQHLNSNSNVIPELWASSDCPARDKAGNATKFVLPTIANGFVYLGSMDPTDSTNTRGELDVFRLTSDACK